jgi:hypothetical protein
LVLIILALLTTLLLPRWGHPESFDEDMRAIREEFITRELTLIHEACHTLRTNPYVRCMGMAVTGRAFFLIEYRTPEALTAPDLVEAIRVLGDVFCATMRDYAQPARYVEALRWMQVLQVYDCQQQAWLPPVSYDDHGTRLQEAPGQW